MKRILVLLSAMIVCAQLARAGDVKVEVKMNTEPGGEGMTSFAAKKLRQIAPARRVRRDALFGF